MNKHLTTLRSFVHARHTARLGALIVARLSMVVFYYGAVAAILQLLFTFFPWTLLPFIWDGITLLAGATTLFIIADTLLLHRPGLLSTARLLENNAAESVPHPLLSIGLELGEVAADHELQHEVLRRAVEQISVFRRIKMPAQKLWRLVAAGIAVACFLGSTGLLNPQLISYWQLPFSMFSVTSATVAPGSIDIPQGAAVTLRFVPQRQIAPACRLTITTAGQGGRTVRWLRDDGQGAFLQKFDSVTTSFTYKFSYGTSVYTPESVMVIPPPYVQRLQVELYPPAYTGLPKRSLQAGLGDFVAYAGSKARFTIESKALRTAILRTDDTAISLAISGNIATGTMLVGRSTSYTFQLIDTFSQHSDSSARYTIGLLPDEPPEIRFLLPGKNKTLEPAQQESLFVEANDDLGVRSCFLYWYKSGENSGEPSRQDLSPQHPERLWRKEFLWNISRLSLYPGDTLYYWARVRDTRSSPSPHNVASDTFFFRLPGFEELHKAMASRDTDARETIGSVLKRQDALMKSVEQLDKATSPRSNVAAWDRRQLAQNVEQAMGQQADSLQKSVEKLEENIRQLTREGDMAETIARKMDEIRAAMKELVAMYGDSLLFPKDESGEISLDDMRQAVDKLNNMLPELAKQLENTLRFLEQLKRDRELAELAMAAEKLASEQARLAEDNRNNQTASRQKDLLDRIDALKKEIQQQSQSGDGKEPDEQTMQQIDSLSREMSQQLSGNTTPPSGSMRQMSGSLSSLAQQLREQMSSFMAQQLEALRSKLLDLAGNTLDMAAWQEQLRSALQSAENDENALRQQALSQQAITEALGIIEGQTDSLPMLPPSLLQKLRADAASAREASKATVASMGEGVDDFVMRMTGQSIRQLAADLLATANAMGQQQGGSCNNGSSGMRESLRRMSGKQAAINSATAQMLRAMLQGKKPGGEGGEGSGGNSPKNEAARKEAKAAQEALANDLKALGEKFGDTGGEGMKERVKQLEEEARALTKMLDQPREEVTERQDRFLARMLQSALSLHREDEGKEDRKSTSAGIIFSKSDNGELADSLIGNNDTFHLLRQRALSGRDYPQEYRPSINAYFDSLGVLFLK